MAVSLKEKRRRVKAREDKVDKLIREGKLDLEKLIEAIHEEQEDVHDLKIKRRKLRLELEAEIEADEEGEGERGEGWERWVEAKRDELADLVETSESRIDRMIEEAARDEAALKELRRLDDKLEERIKRLTKKIQAKKAEDGRLSKDFHIREWDCRDGTPVPDYMEASLRALCREHLQPLRDSGGTVSITSGFRTASYNAQIGGASQSYHVYTIRRASPAADHVQSGRSPQAVQSWHENNNPFDGMGFYAGFTHGDDRGYHSRWYGAG